MLHRNLPVGDSHFPYVWEYANQTARESASGFTEDDVGLFCRQLDDNTIWMLTATTPTWVQIGGSGSGGDEIYKNTSPPTDTSKIWLDTNTNFLKYYDGSGWIKISGDFVLSPTSIANTQKLWIESTTGIMYYYDGDWNPVSKYVDIGTAPVSTYRLWLDTNTEPAILKYYNGSSWIAIQGSSGGIDKIDVRPNRMRLDSVNLGSERGEAWEILDTIDFNPTEIGSIWFSAKFPSNWSLTEDVRLIFDYNCDGNDGGKIVTIQTDVWVADENTIPPDISSPVLTSSDDFNTLSTLNINRLDTYMLPNGKVPATNLNSDTKELIFKITRMSDTYSGTFQLINVILTQ